MHIGLLEDDKSIQEMLRILLQDEGYAATIFPNATECLRAFFPVDQVEAQAGEPIDLLIVDWRLSGSAPGTEVIRALRNDSTFVSLPIILTTAAAIHNTEELQDLDVTLLEKPFALDEIANLIKKLVVPKGF